MHKYNFIILGSDWDLYKFSYSDLDGCPYAKYIAGNYPSRGTLKGLLYRIHFGSRINLPFKRFWNKWYFDADFEEERPLCFVVFNNWLTLNVGIVDYLRKKYAGCKVVWFCQDLVRTQRIRFSKTAFDTDFVKSQFDLSLSFDKKDCERYGLVYHPLVFSSYRGFKKDMPMSDIYILAKAKDRLDDILEIYSVLKCAGLKLDFNILGAQRNARKYEDEINYMDGQYMTYEENVQHILNTRCILEVMQKDGIGFTQRCCEAVCLGKKLLTNNPDVREEWFYDSEYVSTFSSFKDIDKDFIKHISDNVEVDYHYKGQFSPFELLDFIESRL